MIIAKQMDVRSNIKKYFDLAYDGEAVIIPRKNNRNVVIISESEYNELSRFQRLSRYAESISGSEPAGTVQQALNGNVRMHNLEKLNTISNLRDNWNGNQAPALPKAVIAKVSAFLDKLIIQPEIFPTACCTIQLEYDNSRRDHMEIEIGTEDTAEVFIVNFDGSEVIESIPATADAINERAGAFYG